MHQAIKDFRKQFLFKPKIMNVSRWRRAQLGRRRRFVVCGMGGSGLAAKLFKVWRPEILLVVHQSYGLPVLPPSDWRDALVILSSYSGNTEEVLDAFREAQRRRLLMAALTTGGKLLALAKGSGLPYIQMPSTGIQPRMATGLNFISLLKFFSQAAALREIKNLAPALEAWQNSTMRAGQQLAEKLRDRVPIIYASDRNGPLAENWKIKFNETGKVPAFYNILPEMNHNEMTGFDLAPSTAALSQKFAFVFLKDASDHERVRRRMAILREVLAKRKLPVVEIALAMKGASRGGIDSLAKIFSTLLIADWAAYFLAQYYGVEATEVPMVEEFKKALR